MDWGRIVDQMIRDAQAAGKFNDLAGQGRPLTLDGSDETAETWAADHLLKNAGARPAWLEEDLALRQEAEQARAECARSWAWRAAELAALDETAARRAWVEGEWARAQARFEQTLAGLNQRRRLLNLQLPSDRLQRPLLESAAELAHIMRA